MISPDQKSFFRSWLRAPLRVAAVSPSSAALARLITSEIEPGSGAVLELGPGTGVFTSALLSRGFEQHELTLVELGEEFARLLGARYPHAALVTVDASRRDLAEILPSRAHVATVSGLPLLSMNPWRVSGVLRGAFEAMGERGAFYQFTYSWNCPVPDPVLRRLDLEAVRIGATFRNLPPATVYRISRKGASRSRS